MPKVLMTSDEWEAILKEAAPEFTISEEERKDWRSYSEIAGIAGLSHRWIQRLVQEGAKAGRIRPCRYMYNPAGAPLSLWYFPEVAAELIVRRQKNIHHKNICVRQQQDAKAKKATKGKK